MFARKVKQVFDKLLSFKKRKNARKNVTKFFKDCEKLYMKEYKNGSRVGLDGIMTKCIGKNDELGKNKKGHTKETQKPTESK